MPQLDLTIYSTALFLVGFASIFIFITLAGSSFLLAYCRSGIVFFLRLVFRFFFIGSLCKLLFFFRFHLNLYYQILLLTLVRSSALAWE